MNYEQIEDFATAYELTAVKLRHSLDANEEIQIDEPAKCSRGDDGYWVQAWLWAPNK